MRPVAVLHQIGWTVDLLEAWRRRTTNTEREREIEARQQALRMSRGAVVEMALALEAARRQLTATAANARASRAHFETIEQIDKALAHCPPGDR